MARLCIFLITAALIAGMGGAYYVGGGNTPLAQNLEIRTWYDLDAITDNLDGDHILMNDLDSTIAGYEELASPTANQGKGWEPIGFFGEISGGGGCGSYGVAPWWYGLTGTFDGQGYEIRDLFINRPDECHVSPMGLFGSIDEGGIIKNVGVVNVTVIGCESVGGLAGWNYYGTVSNSYSSGNITGERYVGGLVGHNSGTVSNSFWDIETSGQNISAGGTGKNTTEMQDIATFSGAGWDIIEVALNETNPAYIWNIVGNVTYPFLSWQS